MKLSHIRTVCEIAERGFSMSAAAAALNRSQPALSRQIADLERELGVRVFSRTRNKIVGLTPQGAQIMTAGQRIARETEDLKKLISNEGQGEHELRIATTHSHARYTLPRVIQRFNAQHPKVVLNLRQGADPQQCANLVALGKADIGVTTSIEDPPRGTVAIPAFKLSRCLFAPKLHAVTRKKLTLQRIAQYPLIAYSRPPEGRWLFGSVFSDAGLKPHIVLNAIDADVSKTYVALGLGIAVLASIAYDPAHDRKLVAINVDHIFRPGMIVVIFRRGAYISQHTLDFLSLFAPHLNAETAIRWVDGKEIDRAEFSHLAPFASFV